MVKVMSKQTFLATVAQQDNFYIINFPDYPQLFTQATHSREVDGMAKDLLHNALDIPLEDIEIDTKVISIEALTV